MSRMSRNLNGPKPKAAPSLTFNVAHFAALHGEWLQHGRHHSGLLLSNQRPLGDLLRRLLNLAHAFDAESMRDRLNS